MNLLGIEVTDEQVAAMAARIAPDAQPFWGLVSLLEQTGAVVITAEPGLEQMATYGLYGADATAPHVLLTQRAFDALPRGVRAKLVAAQTDCGREAVPRVDDWPVVAPHVEDQADGVRFVWWPSLVQGIEADVVVDFLADAGPASLHSEVPDAAWKACARLLPAARALAGSFADASGPNCFGTVMGAAGVDGAANEWVQRDAFEQFLSARAGSMASGDLDEPGVVLVWRDGEGAPQHAAVILDDGWVLNKDAQCWWAPRTVRRLDELLTAWEPRGFTVERRRLTLSS